MTPTICIALVIFFEAGIEPPIGQAATGWVVVNSAKTMYKKPVSICWEALHSGRYIGVNNNFNLERMPSSIVWKHSLKIAKEILSGNLPDPTMGATYFECTDVNACAVPPPWSVGMEYRGRFGTQDFYKRIE